MKAFRISIFIFLIIFIPLVLSSFKNEGDSELVSPLARIIENIPGIPHSRLKEITAKAMQGSTGEYSFFIKNLKTGEYYSQGENKIFSTGSLYKLWIMDVAYSQIQKGKLDRNQILSEDVSVLNAKFGISSESAELKDGKITLSVVGALSQMITISSNYAAYLLTEKIGLTVVANFLKQEKFMQSGLGNSGGQPGSTAYDIASFFERLYKGELINKEYSAEMLSLLKKQKLNNKLPKKLPANTVIAHKTGEIDYYSHDAGIVFGPKSDYIIVVLSKSSYPPGAEDRIATLSKAVYDYFEK